MAPTSQISFLEHVNLTIPSGEKNFALARAFYFDVLGCAEDPRPKELMGRSDGLVWANLGIQQFHLPVDKKAQVLRGVIGIETRDLEALADNAERHMKAGTFKGTEFSMRRTSWSAPLAFEPPTMSLLLTCPFGNKFMITQAQENGAKGDKRFWINPHDTERSQGHPKGPNFKDLATGIRFLEFNVPAGAGPYLFEFYRDVLGAKCSHVNLHEGEDAVSGQLSGRRKALVVWIGDNNDQFIAFKEVAEGTPIPEYDGHHVAMYINSFIHSHSVAEDRGLIFSNHRFQHLDKAEDWEKVQQFRLLDVFDDEGNSIWKLELEVRSFQNRFCPVIKKGAPQAQPNL